MPAPRSLVGSNVTTRLVALYDTVPATACAVAWSVRVTVVPLIVLAVMASLNVPVGLIVAATPVAPLAGVVAVTVGGVVSTGGAPPQVSLASAQSPWS